jgi:membrane protease YdiL (CAAX protease family)
MTTTTLPAAMPARSRWRIWLGLLLALGIVSLPFSLWIDEFANVRHLIANETIWWVYIVGMLVYVVGVERRSLSSIGFRRPGVRDIAIGIGAGIAILAALAFVYYLIFPLLHWDLSQGMNQLAATPFWWRLISTVRAAVSEEVLFRGYAMERLHELTGSRKIAAGVSCAIFMLDHVPTWGWEHLAIAGIGGISLTLLYLWRRNLWVNILAHFIVDAASML